MEPNDLEARVKLLEGMVRMLMLERQNALKAKRAARVREAYTDKLLSSFDPND